MNAAFLMTTLITGADPVTLPAPTPNPAAILMAAPIGGCGTPTGCGGGCNSCGETPRCGSCVGTGASDPCKDDNKKPTLFGKIKDHIGKAGKPGDCKVDNCGTNGGCGTQAAAGGCNSCGTGGILGRMKHKSAATVAAPACDICTAPVIPFAPVHTPAPVVPLTPVPPTKDKETPKVPGKTGVTIPDILSRTGGTRSNF